MSIFSSRVVAIWLFCCYFQQTTAGDKTTQKHQFGEDVVTATIQKIQNSCIFPNDHQFLRRVAWASTHFGNDLKHRWKTDVSKRGIWNFTAEQFEKSLVRLKHYSKQIQANFGIDVSQIRWDNGDLEVPIIAGLIARASVDENLPLRLQSQSMLYGKLQVNNNGQAAEKEFVESSKALSDQCTSGGADILFILDRSESISAKDFETMKQFVAEVIEGLPIGGNYNRIAVITFDDTVVTELNFNENEKKSGLILKVRNMHRYSAGGTHTSYALQASRDTIFTRFTSRGAAFPRIAILLTDGDPNLPLVRYPKKAAEAEAHNLIASGIELFTIGIGSDVQSEWLREISSHPKCMHSYTLNSFAELVEGFRAELIARTCLAVATVDSAANDFINRSIDVQDQQFYLFPTNVQTGRTLILESPSQAIKMFISTTERNPTDKNNDFVINTTNNGTGCIMLEYGYLTKHCGASNCNGNMTDVYAAVTMTGFQDQTSTSFSLDISGRHTIPANCIKSSVLIQQTTPQDIPDYGDSAFEHQPSAPDYPSSASEYQINTHEYPPTTSDYQTNTSEYQSGSFQYQTNKSEYQSSTSEFPSGSSVHESSTSENQSNTSKHQQSTSEYQSSTIEYHQNGSDVHHNTSFNNLNAPDKLAEKLAKNNPWIWIGLVLGAAIIAAAVLAALKMLGSQSQSGVYKVKNDNGEIYANQDDESLLQ